MIPKNWIQNTKIQNLPLEWQCLWELTYMISHRYVSGKILINREIIHRSMNNHTSKPFKVRILSCFQQRCEMFGLAVYLYPQSRSLNNYSIESVILEVFQLRKPWYIRISRISCLLWFRKIFITRILNTFPYINTCSW